MSIEAMSACWGPGFPTKAPGISAATVRIVALAVADVVNDAYGYRFYASRSRVAVKVGCDPDTVGDVFRHLVENRVLRVVTALPGKAVEYEWLLRTCGEPPHPLRRTTAPPAVTSPHHNTNRSQRDTRASDGRRDYASTPLTPEQISERYGVSIEP